MPSSGRGGASTLLRHASDPRLPRAGDASPARAAPAPCRTAARTHAAFVRSAPKRGNNRTKSLLSRLRHVPQLADTSAAMRVPYRRSPR